MPIEKIINSFNFSILTLSQRKRENEKVLESEAKLKYDSYSKGLEGLDTIVQKLGEGDKSTELEKRASSILNGLKYQLDNEKSRKTFETYINCWRSLTKFLHCTNHKLIKESYLILEKSLIEAPLSKTLLPSLLHISTIVLRSLINTVSADVINTVVLVFTHLYYHHLVGNISKAFSKAIKEILAIKKQFCNEVKEENCSVVNQNDIIIVLRIVDVICQSKSVADETNFEFCNIQMECVLLLRHALHLWNVNSRMNRLDEQTCRLIQHDCDFSSTYAPYWLQNMLALQTLAEMAKSNKKVLELYLQLGENSVHWFNRQSGNKIESESRSEENHTADENCVLIPTKPSIIDKVKKFLEEENHLVEIQREKEINNAEKCEAACENSTETEKPSHKKGPTQTNPMKQHTPKQWCHDLVVVYLQRLGDVVVAGMTSEIQKLALFGSQEHQHGLVHFLQYTSEQVRSSSYELLECIYWSIDNQCLKKSLMDTLDKQKHNYAKHPPRNSPSRGELHVKMATNLAIVCFPPSSKPEKERPMPVFQPVIVEDLSKPQKSVTVKRTRIFVGESISTVPQQRACMAREVHSLAAEHFLREVTEDEHEREMIQQRKQKHGGDGIF